jgi:hypothetical protein
LQRGHGVIIINTGDDLFEAPPADEGYSAAIPVVMIKAKDATALLVSGNSSCLGKPTVTNNAAPLTKVVDFTREDLDNFGIADLRSTDFIEAGGSYFKPLASTAEILANPALAEALLQKTEFTQQEWDAFGVDGLRMHHVVKSGDSYFQPFVAVTSTRGCYKEGQTQPTCACCARSPTTATLATTAGSVGRGAWAMWSWWARR